MNQSNHKYKFLLATFFACVIVFGFATNVLADDNQPNYGDPIDVDGDPSDWDLPLDHFAVMYRNNEGVIPEADVYLRFDHSQGILNILVISQNGQNVHTGNGQYVAVDDVTVADVSQDDAPPDTFLPEFAFVGESGGTAEGWEASILWADAIDNPPPSHEIFIHLNLDYGTSVPQKAWIQVPIYVYDWDFGDLLDDYQTLEASNGPKHALGSLRLGDLVDGEADGQPSASSTEDDLVDLPDEDGVLPTGLWAVSPTIGYTVTNCIPGPCYLSGWIDWNHDNSFDNSVGSNEIIFSGQAVSEGFHSASFSKPEDVNIEATFNTRFRLCETPDGCSTPGADPTGLIPAGEVEDYQWSFGPNAVTINSFTATPTQNSPILYIVAGSVAAILFASVIAFYTKRKNQKYYL